MECAVWTSWSWRGLPRFGAIATKTGGQGHSVRSSQDRLGDKGNTRTMFSKKNHSDPKKSQDVKIWTDIYRPNTVSWIRTKTVHFDGFRRPIWWPKILSRFHLKNGNSQKVSRTTMYWSKSCTKQAVNTSLLDVVPPVLILKPCFSKFRATNVCEQRLVHTVDTLWCLFHKQTPSKLSERKPLNLIQQLASKPVWWPSLWQAEDRRGLQIAGHIIQQSLSIPRWGKRIFG